MSHETKDPVLSETILKALNAKERVYRDEACRRVFTQFNNSALRKRRKIKEVVTFEDLFVSGLSGPQLIETIHSLLRDGIFEWNSTDRAQVIFPQLFTPQISNLQQTKEHTFRNAVPVDMSVNAGLQKELLISMEWLLLTGTYSDLIISAGRQYNLHKSVICPRSSALKLACKHNKTPTPTIDLKEEEYEAVDRLIQYFYRLNYDTHNSVPIDAESSIAPVPPFDRTEESKNAEPSDLTLHVRVYALAEKYVIGGLKVLALEKFNAAVSRHWDTDNFHEAIEEAYSSTIESDRGIRDAIINALYEHRQRLIAKDCIQAVLKQVNSLAVEYIMYSEKRSSQQPQGSFSGWS